jgi:hypothetical protein
MGLVPGGDLLLSPGLNRPLIERLSSQGVELRVTSRRRARGHRSAAGVAGFTSAPRGDLQRRVVAEGRPMKLTDQLIRGPSRGRAPLRRNQAAVLDRRLSLCTKSLCAGQVQYVR